VDEYAELLRLIEDAERMERERPDLCYVSGPTITRFHNDRDCLRRLLRAPNQSGKTMAGAKEANDHAILMPGSIGLVVIAKWEHYGTICRKLHEVCALSELHPDTRYVEGAGFFTNGARRVKYANGSTMEFRSGRSDVQALEALTADWVWVDEVPNETHWGGIVRAAFAKNAPIWMTFTPIGRPVAWLKEKVEGDEIAGIEPAKGADGEPIWRQYVPQLSVRECYWLTDERIAQIIEEYPEEERLQRTKGSWEGITTERAFTAYTNHAVESYNAPPSDAQWALGMDHGELAGHETAVLVAYVRGRDWTTLWVVDEYISASRTTEEDDARGLMAMFARNGIRATQIARAVGDTNSGGKGARGESINSIISRAVASECGFAAHRPPFTLEPANKKGGMMAAGVKLINNGLARGQLHVSPRCRQGQASLRHWRGKDDEYKHWVDAFRYIATPLLDSLSVPVARLGKGIARRR